jgi:hypothetical protein
MPMRTPYRDPQVEEGLRNIILQNRCGNRLTLMFHADRTELEFVYKPNAYRRKDFAGRNFSSRDNFTALFAEAVMPEITSGMIKQFDYDPFVTRLATLSESHAANKIVVINIADENCFAVVARCPLLLSFRPHKAFAVRDGLITESFEDRGEQIVSFVHFGGFEVNRFRVLADGRHVLQLLENDVLLVGGEENIAQVTRVIRAMGSLSAEELIARNERIIGPVLGQSRLHLNDSDLQRVIDLNKRIAYSGLDEGGACFGALCRIYHLIWIRDGAMAASYMALAGNPRFAQIWTPFCLHNPSVRMNDQGQVVREYLQLLGTRWTKGEDDGIYYAVLSLFALYQTTGDDSLLSDGELVPLMQILDRHIAARFDEKRGMFGSDTRGESTLASSPYYGYDTVTGEMDKHRIGSAKKGRVISRCYSLYNNVNMYNALRMMQTVLAGNPAQRRAAGEKYAALAGKIQEAINGQFLREDGTFWADLLIYGDGQEEWIDFRHADWWEYAWAVSTGPFFPNLVAALASARMVKEVWPTIVDYGYCPWNSLSRMLKEYGMSSGAYRQMMDDQLREALALTQKYAMPGAVTEYYRMVDSWRALPFGIAQLVASATSLLIQPLANGLAVRASDLLERIDNFCWRTARIEATSEGRGDVVQSVSVNGRPLVGCLQLPERWLRMGHNEVCVKRGASFDGVRLYSSNVAVLDVTREEAGLRYELGCGGVGATQLVFENWGRVKGVRVEDGSGRELKYEAEGLLDTGLTVVTIEEGFEVGYCVVSVK